jgi:hypothetical protein
MLQASVCDGCSLDAFPLGEDCVGSAEVDVGRGQVASGASARSFPGSVDDTAPRAQCLAATMNQKSSLRESPSICLSGADGEQSGRGPDREYAVGGARRNDLASLLSKLPSSEPDSQARSVQLQCSM